MKTLVVVVVVAGVIVDTIGGKDVFPVVMSLVVNDEDGILDD
jgi:hypothetical protein